MARVAIAAPLRNVAWVLPRYLACLDALDYEPSQLSYIFLLNDCQDETEAILINWLKDRDQAEAEAEVEAKIEAGIEDIGEGPSPPASEVKRKQVIILRRDFGYPWWRRDQGGGRGYSKENLAIMRNLIREAFLASDCDYLFSVDSDTLVPPSILKKLLAAEKDWIGPLIVAHPQGPVYNIMLWDEQTSTFTRQGLRIPADNRLFPVGVIGGCCLYSRSFLERCRFAYHPRGEHLGLALEALRQGFNPPAWCDPDPAIRPQHLLDLDQSS